MSENPNFYAILTANVRYSKSINANEKLLFAEITSLSNSTGICWASNAYFSNLFDCTPQAISKWIKNLEKNGFILCEYIYKQGTKEVEKRLIKCINIHLDGINNGLIGINTGIKGINHSLGGYQHTIKENIKITNNKKNNKKEYLIEHVSSFDNLSLNKEALLEWLEFKKYSYQEVGITKLINMLLKHSKETQQQMIDTSIRNNWSGLFEPKQNSKQSYIDRCTNEGARTYEAPVDEKRPF